MTHNFNPTILREYDIRGIVGDTLTEDDAYGLGRTYAAIAREEGARRIAVGRDGRTHSGMLEAALVRGLTDGGVDAVWALINSKEYLNRLDTLKSNDPRKAVEKK